MRKTHECENKFFAFGIDRVSGVFLQFQSKMEDSEIVNWSEFGPFNRRFTYDAIQKSIKDGELLESEFKEICKVPFGDFNVYFSGIMVTEDAPDNFEIPKRLLQKHLNGKPFRIRTLGDYYRVLKMFKEHVTFSKVSWYPYSTHSTGVLYEFINDKELNETGLNTCKPKLYQMSEDHIGPDGVKGVFINWIDKAGKEHGPRTCSDCKEPMWEGHVFNDGDEYYCLDCIDKHYTAQERADMYDEETLYYTEWDETELMEDFELVYNVEKYMVAIKSNFSSGFYEKGHCFRCKIEGDKVILDSELNRWPEKISIAQFEEDFVEMSKEDYELYFKLCENGENHETLLKKYLN